ncbi:DUF2490 domain-containing protein [Solitalea koreensis]|uniref:DUF2490 domain-containing protein n=1 Tax=Solitalea koreensis TaxID=543615 RepID=A0A521DQQ4_9SPHI|nr:DUF2490 domain-containing protein [Solitalea koreensis]SMO73260.1 Protein of unknown function [Solitalea koreensis]
MVRFTAFRIKCHGVILMLCLPVLVFAQSASEKEINHQSQVWVSINNTFRINEHWGALADFHIRRNDFLADPSFYFIRGAANYWIKDNITAALGYGHMWLAPTQEDWHTFANENRIYQQFQVNSKFGRSFILQRLRNEQRWQQKIVDDQRTDDYKFTDRVRYLFSYTYTIFQNKYLPSLVVADEILIQFGKEVVYNAFEQNRIFFGVKQNIRSSLSFDFGYMNVYQQKSSGYQYDMNHTLRLFFYYNAGWRRVNKQPFIESGGE